MAKPIISNFGPIKKVAGHGNAWEGVIAANSETADLEDFFVKSVLSAPTRCIDGRPIKHWLDDELLKKRALGPQISGGTASVALVSMAISDSKDYKTALMQVLNKLSTLHVGYGGHTDDHAKSPATGCGAVDKMALIVSKINEPKAEAALLALSESILEGLYSRTDISLVTQKLAKASLDGTDQTQAIMQAKADIKNPVETLVGEHNEKIICVNKVPGTTFDRDKFSIQHKNKIQVFNYDAWFPAQLADALFPDDEANQSLFVHGLTLYALATAMVLTDGSLSLLVRA